MASSFPFNKFVMVMVFYAILACVIMPVAFYYLLGKTLVSAGNGFMVGSVVNILLWNFLGYHYIKGT